MIKEKIIDFRINNNMVQFYSKKLNMNLVSGQIIKIDVNDLSIGSHAEITCICDMCGFEKIMNYRNYINVTKFDIDNKYYCHKCAVGKKEKKMLEKYGVKHALQLEKFKTKAKNTWLQNYGVDHPAKCKKIKDKFNKTMMKRYGVKNAIENKQILNLMKSKIFNKYSMYFVETDEFKTKSKLSCLKNLGCENSSQNENVRRKKVNTCMERYGVEHHFQNVEIFNKLLLSSCKMKKYKNLYYQGSFEKDFLDLCEKLNILDFVKRGCTIRYIMNDKNLIYFPDFIKKK